MSLTKQELINSFEEWLSIPENTKYRKWNDELLKYGFQLDVNFIPSDVSSSSFLHEELISRLFVYKYQGDFSVEGDHAYDIFYLYARLLENGVQFVYTSSYINEIYATDNGMAQTQEEVDGYVEKIRVHLDKNSRFLGKSFEVEEHYGRVSFALLTETLYSKLHVLEPFIRLAILLDIQTERKFPFHSIEDYERIYGNLSDVEFFSSIVQYSNAFDESIAHLVGSSYSQKLADVVSRVKGLVSEFSQNSEQNEAVIALLSEILANLRGMTPEEYAELKNTIFDT